MLLLGPNAQRKLAAVIALDVVGFSAMMNQDELGTLRRVQAFQKEIVGPLVHQNRGRVFKLIGDGALADFQSVHDAFSAAQGILERLGESDLRLRVRIGLHIGDLIFEDGDVFGDGVNIAARLEGIARPGAIAVSERAYTELGKLHSNFEDLGKVNLKNIKDPVRVFLYESIHSKYRFKIPWIPSRHKNALGALVGILILSIPSYFGWRAYVSSPERLIRRDLGSYPCSWLGVRSISSVNGASLVEIEGGTLRDKEELRNKLLVNIAREYKKPVSLNLDGVSAIPSSFCSFSERFRGIRYDGPRRLTLSRIEGPQSSAMGSIFSKAKTHEITIRMYGDAFRENATLFGMWNSGSIRRMASIKEFKREYSKKFPSAMSILEADLDQCLTFYLFPRNHWLKIRTSNKLERLNLEIRRRNRFVEKSPEP